MRLHKSVLADVNVLSRLLEEGADLLSALTVHSFVLGLGPLGHVDGEHVFRSVDILAEVVVVDLLGVSAVTVTASDQGEHLVTWRHQVQVFHDAQELLSRDVQLLRSVEVGKAWLEEDAVGNNVLVEGRHHLVHLLLLLVVENLFEFVSKGNFVTYSGSTGVLDDLCRVDLLREDDVEVVDKVTVVDKATSRRGLVLRDQVVGLLLSKVDSEGANASAELEREERLGFGCYGNLQRLLRRCPCGVCRSR